MKHQQDRTITLHSNDDSNDDVERKPPSIEMSDISSSNPNTTQPLLSENSPSSNHSKMTTPDNENSRDFSKMDDRDSHRIVRAAQTSGPFDRYNLVYLTLMLHGVAILMPWNMFINATEYFTEYKLKIRTENGTLIDSGFRNYFLNYLGICSQIPNVLFNILNIFFHFGQGSAIRSYTYRIMVAIIIELFFMIFTVILAILDTSTWVNLFFYLTMLTVILLNTVNGIYQNSVYGLSSCLPMKFTNAIVTGNNVCGTFTALMNIVTIWLSPNKQIAAVYFFSSTIFVLILAMVSFILLQKNKYYQYYIEKDSFDKICQNSARKKEEGGGEIKTENANLISSDGGSMIASNDPKSKRSTYSYVFGYVWKQCLNVFLVFFVTLSIFPVIQSAIKPINPELFGSVESTDNYFVAVCCFFVFNASAMIGNIVPNFVIFPAPDRLWIPVVARFLFIPFFLFCNYAPERRKWPVWIQSDPLYIFGSILFGLSSGYYSSLCMMYAPRSVPDSKYAGTAGMMAAASLVTGIFVGVNFSSVLAWLVTK